MQCLLLAPLLLSQDLGAGHLHVDQFGYPPGPSAAKFAVLSDPRAGFNAPDPYTPPAQIELRRADGSLASTLPVAAWNGGATHSQSGDKAWMVDLSALAQPGAYYLHDPANQLDSPVFEIRTSVYDRVLHHALRALYYQRCGLAKAPPQAEAPWSDALCHQDALQDLDCRWVLDTGASTSRDLRGGWHDAGDYNKYINFVDDSVHDLLYAYAWNPAVWHDASGLPESGNGVPDLLDELQWELDWMLRMQLPDGAILHKVSVTDFSAASPPSADAAPRRYAEATGSATVSASGAFAHAALVYQDVAGMQGFATRLQSAAVAAWDWIEAHPGQFPSNYDNQGFQNVSAEDDAYWQDTNRICAAAYLFALTGDTRYRSYLDANYTSAHLLQWGYAYPWEAQFQDALLFYAATPGATASVAGAIRTAYANSLQFTHLPNALTARDPYGAYLADGDYTWGSNRTKANTGLMFFNMAYYGLDAANQATYRAAAEGYLHYLHGVNPLGFVFLTAMEGRGAELSAHEIYHGWFGDGTPWDQFPAPGFVPGGVNPSYQPDPSYGGTIEPPQNQPILKSYRDWNTSWPENSWEVTEPQIAYQAAYIRLLAMFAAPPCLSLTLGTLTAGGSGGFTVIGAPAGGTLAVLYSLDLGYFPFEASGWKVELGLALPPDPRTNLVGMGTANAAGMYTATFPIPSAAAGRTVFFQAALRGTSPDICQSAVMAGTPQ